MAVGNTFVVDKECPICGQKVPVTKVRSRLITLKTDPDFCVYYKDFNPYYYTVWVCEKCGFAADENHFLAHIPERKKKIVQDFLHGRKIGFAHQEIRSRVEAVAAFKLAIFYAQLMEESLGHIASLYLKMGWLFREGGDEEKEKAALTEAIDHYERSLASERYPIGMMTDTMVIFLIGAMYDRVGNAEKATQYLSRIIGDKDARVERNLFNRARDLWQDIRARKEAEEGNAE